MRACLGHGRGGLGELAEARQGHQGTRGDDAVPLDCQGREALHGAAAGTGSMRIAFMWQGRNRLTEKALIGPWSMLWLTAL